jgi:hypothetical protein
MVPSYVIYSFIFGNEIFNLRLNTPGLTEDQAVLIIGFLFLFYGSGLVLFIVQILVIFTSVVLYRHFGEGIKHIRAHLKRQTRNADAGRKALRGNEAESGHSDDLEEEVIQTEEMFQEIFQNTLERAHHVGSLEDDPHKSLLGEEDPYLGFSVN